MAESKGTVLVVDDEQAVLDVASDILQFLGYSVLTSSSGDHALNRLRLGERPDLVLLDIIMPGMNGVEAFRKIREVQPSVPVLISSGYADRMAVQSLTDQGVNGFVNKPYLIETLERRLREVLG